MKTILLKWAIMAASLFLSAWLTRLVLPGFTVEVTSFGQAIGLFLGVAILALVNATIGKLLKLLLLPFNCLTLGLVGLVINAALFMAVGSLGIGFKVESFWAALVGSVLYSAIGAVLGVLVKDEDKKKE